MVRDGCCWWHVVINSCGSWLPGDSRGFRSRDHRIHSSGDYHHRPPAGEHAGLLSYATARTGREVHFSADERTLLGQAILRSLASADVPCIAAAVSATHAHLLVEHDWPWESIHALAARIKQTSSFRVRDAIPGRIWSKGSHPVRISDRAHQHRAYHYILNHETKENAWVWKFDSGSQNPHD